MLDTVKLRSPYISEDVAAVVESALVSRRAIDNGSGVLVYEIVSGPLMGSYDHRISCVVRREEWISVEMPGGKRATVMEPCRPYVEIEGSVHKAMTGHNVYGGPESVLGACTWLIMDLSDRLGVALPYGGDWTVRRIDWTECFDLGAPAVREYIWGLGQASYPRRKPAIYGTETVAFSGRSSMIKFYAKGPEFEKHDKKVLFGSPDTKDRQWVVDLATRAACLLRIEVGIKAPLLDQQYPDGATVSVVNAEWCEIIWVREVMKVLREARVDMDVVRKASDVQYRLHGMYSSRQARMLYATWVSLGTLGETKTRETMTKTSFYRHRAELVAAGVSWLGTDVQIVDAPSLVPADFVPSLSDRRRVVDIEPRVRECLASVGMARRFL